jgi:hypothetical protein
VTNKLIDHLAATYGQLTDQYDVILSGAEADGRDLTDSECAELDHLRSEMLSRPVERSRRRGELLANRRSGPIRCL